MQTTITPIRASSENKDDVYRLLNLVYSMAGSLAVARTGEWELKATCTTPPEYVLTVWTNGIVDVKAETRHGIHEYSMYATPKEADDETLS